MKSPYFKAQAAVEFAITYGWAILALIIVIGVILTSNLFSPNYLISEECNFGNNLPCNFVLFNEGTSTRIVIQFFNAFPYRVQINRTSLQTSDGTLVFLDSSEPILRESGQNFTVRGILERQAPAGTIKRFIGNITFVSCAPEINEISCGTSEHIVSGRITGKVS